MRCVFCDIVQGKVSKQHVFENEEFLAFTPLRPVSTGHVLLIPKKHVENLYELDDEAVGRMFMLAKRVSSELVQKYGATGINVLHASGVDAQQSVLHCHIHIVPRYPDDGLNLWLKNSL